MTNQQGAPEALRLADRLSSNTGHVGGPTIDAAAAELRRLHAENQRLAALVDAQQPAPSPAAVRFDEHGFRAWVLRNMPDDTIIGSSAWWADHLTSWAKRFVKAAPQPSPTPQADSQPAPMRQRKWTWVPVEPSTAMLVAGNHGHPGDFSALKVWQDMLGALERSFDYTRPVDPPSTTPPAQAPHAGRQQEARPCHVFTVRKAGALTEWEPTSMAFALPDGAHALYTLPQPTPPAQAADSVLEDAALLRYACTEGGSNGLKWLAVYERWDGEGYFIDALRTAYKQDAARRQGANHD